MWLRIANSLLCVVCWVVGASLGDCGELLKLSLRYQEPTSDGSPNYHRLVMQDQWKAEQVAVIVCDMWDSHHSVNAVRRAQELAPRIDAFVSRLRQQGSTVIHAPSSCMQQYLDHPARQRTLEVKPAAEFPEQISQWCDQIPSEQSVAYPLDQSQGGEDDDMEELGRWADQLKAQGRKPRQPWLRQIDSIHIDATNDYISDSGQEIWSILADRNISQVMLVGVHVNMCVLGRPFGLRQLVSGGKSVVLVRDLTDTMYDPRAWPYANHFTGTDIMIDHIERHVCPTISSDQVLGDDEFRFANDHRLQLTMLIADDEYKTETTLPEFAAKHLSQSFRVTIAYASDTQRNQIMAIDDVLSADVLLISVRRRTLPIQDLELIRQFVKRGRPMIGIRTASHAFSLRSGQPEPGSGQWPEFDQQVWGGNYAGHFGNELRYGIAISKHEKPHAIVAELGDWSGFQAGGSLYKTAPLAPGTTELLVGAITEKSPHPVAWTYVRADGGRSFYTSLGHVDDFRQLQFQSLLARGIHWACGISLPETSAIESQNVRYASGKGKQRADR